MNACDICRERGSFLRGLMRRTLTGPNGEDLCQVHHREKWAEEMGIDI